MSLPNSDFGYSVICDWGLFILSCFYVYFLKDSNIKLFIISMNTDKFDAAFRTYNQNRLSKNEIQYSLKIIIEVKEK